MGFLNSKLAKAVTAIAKCKFPSPHGVSQFQIILLDTYEREPLISVPSWGFSIPNDCVEMQEMKNQSDFRPLMGFLNSKSRPCLISNHAPSRSVLRGKNKNGALYKNIHSNIQCKRPIFKVRGKISDKTIKISFIVPQTFP